MVKTDSLEKVEQLEQPIGLKDFSRYADSIEKYIFAGAFDELFKYTNISARVLGSWLNKKKCNAILLFDNEALCKHVIKNSNDLNEIDCLITFACRCWNLEAIKELISLKKTLSTPEDIAFYASGVILHERFNFNIYTGNGVVDDPKVHEILKYLFSQDETSECSTEYRKLLYYAIKCASDTIINIILDFMATKKFNLKETLNTKHEYKTIQSELESRKPTINTATLKRFKELGCEFSFTSWYFNKFIKSLPLMP